MDINKLTVGDKAPELINVFIEIPQGSSIKYELDKETGFIFADRIVHGAMFFPFNYGFVPQSHAEDGDPLDVAIISSLPFQAGVVVPARPIGMLEMEDEAGIDTKIIAVPKSKIDPFYKEIEDVEDLPEMIKNRIKNFFDRYKDLEEGKWVKTGDFLGKQQAFDAINKSLK